MKLAKINFTNYIELFDTQITSKLVSREQSFLK